MSNNRITNVEIAGSTYPLNFSTKAAKEISKRYGGLENIGDAFDKPTDEMMDEVIWLLALLIDQGVKYRKLVDGEDVPGIQPEELEIVLGVSDFGKLKDQLLGAMTAGMSREVEVEPEKNAETTQGD